MSFANASVSMTTRQIAQRVIGGSIRFDNVIQRSLVWERERKSLFIHSLLVEIPIQRIYAKRIKTENGKADIFDIMDGQQRLSTIAGFVNGDFALMELPPVSFMNLETNEIEEYDVSDHSFNDLPESLRDKLFNVKLDIIYFEDITFDETRELFKRLNNGKPLTSKNIALANCADLIHLLKIGEHPIFKIALSTKGLKDKKQAIYVMKTYLMLTRDINDIVFESKHYNMLLETTIIPDEYDQKLNNIFDYILKTYEILLSRKEKKQARKIVRETHLISLIPFFNWGINEDIEEEKMADWIVYFFKTNVDLDDIQKAYYDASDKQTTRSSKIIARNRIMNYSFKQFFGYEMRPEDDIKDLYK